MQLRLQLHCSSSSGPSRLLSRRRPKSRSRTPKLPMPRAFDKSQENATFTATRTFRRRVSNTTHLNFRISKPALLLTHALVRRISFHCCHRHRPPFLSVAPVPTHHHTPSLSSANHKQNLVLNPTDAKSSTIRILPSFAAAALEIGKTLRSNHSKLGNGAACRS